STTSFFFSTLLCVAVFYYSNRPIAKTIIKKDSRDHGGCHLLPSCQAGLCSASSLIQSGSTHLEMVLPTVGLDPPTMIKNEDKLQRHTHRLI
ncbi:mCG144707, partial [Mus musculus]